MPYLGNEETLVEIPAINYIKDKLGYILIHGEKLTPQYNERESMSEVILHKRLENALKRLNPWMSEENILKSIRYISRPEGLGASLLEINEKIHDVLVSLTFTVDELNDRGQKKPQTVKFIDFDNIDNNEFLVSRQFKIHGPHENIIPDIIIFVNGIPVVVIECKSPFIETTVNVLAGKHKAYQQLRRYMNERGSNTIEGAPRLFYTNFFTGITNKYHGYIGTITSPQSYYLEWKDPYPFKKTDIENYKDNGQNILIQGLLEKKNLLDIMQNFILFEADSKSGKKVKKVCRYQQFRAVNKALYRLKTSKDTLSRGGVVWHTQGSGKSLTMVFLAGKIRKDSQLSDSTIVVITDRIDLDKQIYKTFVRTLGKYTEPVRANNIKLMKELLSKAQAQIITTTIQKFQSEKEDKEVFNEGNNSLSYEKEFETLTLKSNVIVLTDEAHRSQYTGTARNMRKALPNAAFIGFTGTPIDKDDKSTPRTFGGYVDKYGIKEAVEDGATIKIVYEGRKPELQIKGDTLQDIFEEEFSDRSEEEKEAIKKKYANKRVIVESEHRIEEIAKDILKHYKEQIYPNGFKAQIVCVSRDACVTYYNMLNKHMKNIMGEELEAKVIISGDMNDLPRLKEHHTTKPEQAQIIERFLKPINEDKLCFIIVKDMLLTGFDAPIEQVMYLDRSLKEHNLLQAIARVNRIYNEKKKCGYVVDYYGVTNNLEEALAIFNKDEIGTPMENMDSLFKEMQSYREAVMRIFKGIDKEDLDSLVKVLEKEDKRAEFEMAYKKFASAVEQLLPNHVPVEYTNDLKWLGYIRAATKARYEPQKALDISDCGEKVREIISEHLETSGIKQFIKPLTLFDKDYEKEIGKIGSDEGEASSMEHAIRHVISVKIDNNPVYYTSLLEKLEKILEESNNNWTERKKKLKEFIENDLETGEKNKAEELGLTESEFAFYEVIRKQLNENENSEMVAEEEAVYYVGQEELDLAKDITKNVAEIIKENYVIDWTNNITKTQDIERSIKMMLIKKYFSTFKMNGINKLVPLLLTLAKKHYSRID